MDGLFMSFISLYFAIATNNKVYLQDRNCESPCVYMYSTFSVNNFCSMKM